MEVRRATAAIAQPRITQARSSGGVVISGYASVWHVRGVAGTEYQLAPGMIERVRRGAFAESLRTGDQRALYDHDSANLLGRRSAGTLTLTEDANGLLYVIQLPNTSIGRDVAELVRLRNLTGASIGFRVTAEIWHDENGLDVREIHAIDLSEISLATFPAFQNTTAEVKARSASADSPAVRRRIQGYLARANSLVV